MLHILKVRKLDFPKAVRESLAVELYREGLISLGKAAEIAMVSKWEMFEILAAKKSSFAVLSRGFKNGY